MSTLREQLALKALAALSEIADECGRKPAGKSLSLRFVLAWTFVAAGADPQLKWLWTGFWENATAPRNPARPMDDYLRGSGAQIALNGICREMGYPTGASFFEMLREHRKVHRKLSQAAGAPDRVNDEPDDESAA